MSAVRAGLAPLRWGLLVVGVGLGLLQGSPPLARMPQGAFAKAPLVEAMTLEEKAGQVLMVRAGVVTLPQQMGLGATFDPETAFEAAPAGVPPLLVASDFEFGPRMMVRAGVVTLPQQMGLGATFDPETAFEAARITAREARAMGVNWVLAPVADVNTNPQNPVIGVRAFGDDPAFVASFVTEAVRGYAGMGVLAAAKHFPGHGDTSVDSHLALPRVDYGRDELERHLEPFRAAIAAGVPAIMTAHIVVSTLDPDRPATLSPAVLTGLLREELGFEGVILTDAMNMAAIAEHFGTGEAAVLALNAGADMILSAGSAQDAQAMHRAIVEAVRTGALLEARLDEAVQRVHEPGWLPLDVEALQAEEKGLLVVGVRDSVWTLQEALQARLPALTVEAYRATRARAANGWSPSRSNVRRAVRLARQPEVGAVIVLTYSSQT